MKTKKEIAERQIELQHELQNAGYNLVTCGDCGSILLHEIQDEVIECFCGNHAPSDCPDYWYSGMENNSEFND